MLLFSQEVLVETLIAGQYQISADVDRDTVQIHHLDGNVKDNHVRIRSDISSACDVTKIETYNGNTRIKIEIDNEFNDITNA